MVRLCLDQQGQRDDYSYHNDGGQLERQRKTERLSTPLVNEGDSNSWSGILRANPFRFDFWNGCRGLQRFAPLLTFAYRQP